MMPPPNLDMPWRLARSSACGGPLEPYGYGSGLILFSASSLRMGVKMRQDASSSGAETKFD